jgi:hypothetical protein
VRGGFTRNLRWIGLARPLSKRCAALLTTALAAGPNGRRLSRGFEIDGRGSLLNRLADRSIRHGRRSRTLALVGEGSRRSCPLFRDRSPRVRDDVADRLICYLAARRGGGLHHRGSLPARLFRTGLFCRTEVEFLFCAWPVTY